MNRRNAVLSIFIAGGGLAAALTCGEWLYLNREPNLSFLDDNHTVIGDLAEVILPRTDSPGAREAGVADFIIRMLKDVSDRKTQNNFIAGLEKIKDYSVSRYGKPFSYLEAGQQHNVLLQMQQKEISRRGEEGKWQSKIFGKSFFTALKEYTVIGYCTSKQGAVNGLSYDYVPGIYISCMTEGPGQKTWATK